MMAGGNHIAMISDASVMGGHEVMALKGAKALLASGYQISFLYYGGNARLADEVSALCHENFSPHPTNVKVTTLSSFLPWAFPHQIIECRTILNTSGVDAVLLLQARIETTRIGYWAAKREGIPVLSYVPFAHRSSVVSGRRTAGAVRDFTNTMYYRGMDGFLTCYAGAEKAIQSYAPKMRVEVVDNPLPEQKRNCIDAKRSRAEFGVPFGAKMVVLPGRVSFFHKRQDFAVRFFDDIFDEDTWLVIIGDGPDMNDLQEIVSKSRHRDRIVLAGWRDQISHFLAVSDCVFVPSSFEGMPLVVLEAIACGVPVAASRVDGMVDILPTAWTFEPGSPSQARKAIDNCIPAQRDQVDDLYSSLKKKMDGKKFSDRFANAFKALLVP